MKILIICSYFPPDSDIAAVRPYMLAKYLHKMGHTVSVLCSGKNHSKPDGFLPNLDSIKIITFLHSSPEEYEINIQQKSVIERKKKLEFLPEKIRKPLKKVYHFTEHFIFIVKRLASVKKNYRLQKKALSVISDEHYDVVFSTYSKMENIFAGNYARKIFNAMWVQDFRDPIPEYYTKYNWVWNVLGEEVQKFVLRKADICTTVSDGIREMLEGKDVSGAKIWTLYNGYEPIEHEMIVECKKFTICYTGMMYDIHYVSLMKLLLVIKALIDEGKIRKTSIQFSYAGPDSMRVLRMFEELGLSDILCDYGYVSRDIVFQLQNKSDIFLVLSWNDNKRKGVISGKFYEGIRARKPILAIVAGEVPYSELFQINQKYGYGFCYELSREKEMLPEMKKYILECYWQKMKNGVISYSVPNEFVKKYQYENIARQLEKYIYNLKSELWSSKINHSEHPVS